MKYTFITILLLLFVNINDGFSQCREFAREKCKPKLENYAHDGNINGVVLNVGEQVELHKAFFSGQEYRIVVAAEDFLPRIHFRITDSDLNLIFDNAESNYVDYYNFELDTAKTLIISLDFEEQEFTDANPRSGCVSILFGMKL